MEGGHILWFTFVSMLKRPEVIRALRPHIDLKRYGSVFGSEYFLLFNALISYWDEYGEIPGKETYKLIVSSLATSSGEANDKSYLERLLRCVDQAYSTDPTELNPDVAVKNFKTWYIKEVVRYESAQLPHVSPQAVGGYLEGLTRNVSMVQGAGVFEFAPASISALFKPDETIITMPLGFELFDYFTEGYAAGDVNVLLGPFGGGKTTIAVQSVVDSARHAYRQGDDSLHVFIGYECDSKEAMLRAWAAAAWVPKDRIVALQTGQAAPSTAGNLQQYEIDMYRRMGVTDPAKMVGERERLLACDEFMSKNVVMLDFTGSGGGGKRRDTIRGYGGVDEIATAISALRDATGKSVRMIAVDWAGLLVDRYLAATGARDIDKQRPRKLSGIVDELMRNVAEPNECVVWLTHQIRGAIARKGPAHRFTLGDAEGCSTFHANATFGLVLGTQDKKMRASVLYGEKLRRVAPKDPVICRMYGEVNRMELAPDLVLDTMLKRIVSRDALESLERETSDFDEDFANDIW